MAQTTILLATNDSERSQSLKACLEKDGLTVATAAGAPAAMVVDICDKEPWQRARTLVGQTPRVMVFAVGLPEERPGDLPAGVDVELWIGGQSAAEMVKQALEEPLAPAAAPQTVSESEPEMVEDASVMEDEPSLVGETEVEAVGATSAGPAAPPSLAQRTAPTGLPPEITPEDETFIMRVFHQVKDVDFREPPPPPPRKELGGIDKKMAFLRQRVRELERDLARIGFVWQIKKQKVEQVEKIIAVKEAERESAVLRYQQIKDQATRASAEYRNQNAALAAQAAMLTERVAGLERANADLTIQLQQAIDRYQMEIQDLSARVNQDEQEKNALVADFRKKIEAAQSAFNELRDRSAKVIADLESRIKAQQADLEDRDRTLKNFADEMGRIRTGNEERLQELKTGLKERDERIVALTSEISSARAEYAKLGEQVGAQRTEAKAAAEKLKELEAELETEKQRAQVAGEQLKMRETELEAEKKRADAASVPETNPASADTPSSNSGTGQP